MLICQNFNHEPTYKCNTANLNQKHKFILPFALPSHLTSDLILATSHLFLQKKKFKNFTLIAIHIKVTNISGFNLVYMYVKLKRWKEENNVQSSDSSWSFHFFFFLFSCLCAFCYKQTWKTQKRQSIGYKFFFIGKFLTNQCLNYLPL